MKIPAYVTTSDLVYLYDASLFKIESYKLKQTIYFHKENPKNIQYLHNQVHYIQLPCNATLIFIVFLQMPTHFLNRQNKAAQNA
jgi:hypothetical protein